MKYTKEDLTIVTGASSNHFRCLKNLLYSISLFERETKVVVYDLGLKKREFEELIHDGWEVRRFDFKKYPKHLRIKEVKKKNDLYHGENAGCFAWKAVIISDILKESRSMVLWLDAGDLVMKRLSEIRKTLSGYGIYTPTSSGNIKDWSHKGTIRCMHVSLELQSRKNRNAAIVGLNYRFSFARKLSDFWRKYCLDRRCIMPKGANWHNHRYDQPILSILYYQIQEVSKFPSIDKMLGISTHKDHLSFAEAKKILAELKRKRNFISSVISPFWRNKNDL